MTDVNNDDKDQEKIQEEKNGKGYLKRAKSDNLLEIFNKYASYERNGEKLMTPEDFVRRYLGLFESTDYNADSVRLLASIVDTNKDGFISYAKFQAFEELLCYSDALYKAIFQLFDVYGKGMVSFSGFAEVLAKTEHHQKTPFNMESPFVQLYFGKNKQRLIPYRDFTQFLQDFQAEYAIEGFRRADKDGTGYISNKDFQNIMVNNRSHLLTKQVQSYLTEATEEDQPGRRISFPYFVAFNSLLYNMELVKRIYLNATKGKKRQGLTEEEFMHSAEKMSQMTPLEIHILFKLSNVLNQRRRIVYNDFNAMAPEQYFTKLTDKLSEIKGNTESRGVLIQMAESFYRFSLGSVAGAVGATAVFPIDLVKTRMQNQREGLVKGKLLYTSYFDCFKKVVRQEGILGLYRGLVPLLCGVAPEKALKLTMNDFVRDKFYDKDGNIPLYGEIISGGCAGLSQVIFTNPLEIVKIRLQVAGEVAGGSKMRAWAVVKELGLFGLYKGARACILRDIPFNAIYFTVYSNTKLKLADENGYNNPLSLLLAGTISGVPAASLVTPADVIKTRIQVVARSGQTSYSGVIDAVKKLMAEEGFKAFWKGTLARVVRSAPQFGVTLVTYELLQRIFYIDFGGIRPSGSEAKDSTGSAEDQQKSSKSDHVGGYSVAVPVFAGIETKFGISLPKFKVVKNVPP